MRKIPCLFFPTKVVLVDDAIDFLKNLEMSLPKESSTYCAYSNPVSALSFINESCVLGFDELATFSATGINQAGANFNVQEIYKEIYNENRFDRISVVVVDYDMPELNGIELLKKIKNPNIQKIMLTGEADESTAVNAFNDGIIDKYIKKGGKDSLKVLQKAIYDCQIDYFLKLTDHALESVRQSSNEYELSALNSLECQEFIYSKLQGGEVSEFYLFEKTGSFLLVDKQGNVEGLFIRNEDQMETIAEESAGSGEGLNEKIKREIVSRKKLLCFRPEIDTPLPAFTEWEEYLQEAMSMDKEGKLYCAFSKKLPEVSTEKILPFERYIST